MNGIKLCGTGAAAPAKVVTNDDMAAMVETSDEWISTRTGIKERRYCTDETLLSLCTDHGPGGHLPRRPGGVPGGHHLPRLHHPRPLLPAPA